ncbi:hypothetical protein [Prosthecobacter vanneervenii]|uniref:Uncharacterized protein n=1 Tax=Prosthecobacter vanneervenii TaxID=48466 RepID=A0A7W7Y772_9BACT|nr:hypothetical protein [Prosthecobacter vanneervenii]MBB5030869.1 hypothetical protein [Prosthecobacter vanneervenii]
MKREKLRRFLFVGAVCLLSFPWLTPCAGIWFAAAVDSVHSVVTHRDEREYKLPSKQLKEWAAKQVPKLKVRENQPIPSGMQIIDAELSAANGGRSASRPGTLVGRGASAVVDGLTSTLTWVDPATWLFYDTLDTKPSTPKRRLILREKPFVMIEGDDLRYTSEGKNGPVRLARARKARLTVITPDGTCRINASAIHYRGPAADEVLLEGMDSVNTRTQVLWPANRGDAVVLNFVNRSVSFSGRMGDGLRSFSIKASPDSKIGGPPAPGPPTAGKKHTP